jgi:Ser/Thr protein kinase RdoA (MazF antagonist)
MAFVLPPMGRMSASLPDLVARAVLGHYATEIATAHLTALGNRGGFSGARLWQITSVAGPFCLRAWPSDGPTPEQLNWIHSLMARARHTGLDFVPLIIPGRSGATWMQHEGRLWEVTTWQAGRADFHAQPTPGRLEAACTALAQLHGVWAEATRTVGPCPAVQRRLERAREWARLVQDGWQPQFEESEDDPIEPWARRAWPLLRAQVNWVPRALACFATWSAPLQPCLCDIWHDHVLFDGEQITGIIDYGGVAVDHVAADLARLLGSLAQDDAALWAAGLSSYTRRRLLTRDEERLVRLLDETGTLLGAANWLKWLYWEGRSFEDRAGVARRLAVLVKRLERQRGLV